MSEIKQNKCLGRVLSCANGDVILMSSSGNVDDNVVGYYSGGDLPIGALVTYVSGGNGVANQIKMLNVVDTRIVAVNGNEICLKPNAGNAPGILCSTSIISGITIYKVGLPMRCYIDDEGVVKQVHFMRDHYTKNIEHSVINSEFSEGDVFHMAIPNNMPMICADLGIPNPLYYAPLIDTHMRKYACALLNTRAGVIVFGVQPTANNRVQGLWFDDEGRLNFMSCAIGATLKKFGQDIPAKCKVEFYALRGVAGRYIVVVHVGRGDEGRVYADADTGNKWIINAAGECVCI